MECRLAAVLFTAVDGGALDGALDLAGLLVLQLSRLGGGNLLLADLLVLLQRESRRSAVCQ